MNQSDLYKEFDRQLENLVEKGYPNATNLSEEAFRSKITPLRSRLEGLGLPDVDLAKGTLPYVIVIKSNLIPAEEMMALVEKDGKKGVTILRPLTSINFKVIDEIEVPEGIIYLLLNIDRGKENINLPPKEAINHIKKAGRSPLTIDEGIAILTQFPDFLIKNNCYSLLASRTGTDQRVPAIWINSKKEPNLGWCWYGNPHTWLGSASCVKRVAKIVN
jgi:hypothetical protein